MKNSNDLLNDIRQILTDMKDPQETTIHINANDQSFNYIGHGTPITDTQFNMICLDYINDHLTKHGKVHLYYCPDNAEIQFIDDTPEDMREFEDNGYQENELLTTYKD